MRGKLEAVLQRVAASSGTPFAVRFADGREIRVGDSAPAFTFSFRSAAAEWRTVLFGHIGLLESYIARELEVEGSLRVALAAGLASDLATANPLVSLRNRWHELRFSNASWAQAKANARFHYGLGDAFYRLWLDDPLRMYTCAYWKEGTRTLEEAQASKIDHVCAKLRISAGEEVIDIGCGFGGFMFRAHERLGARVTGINTTSEQVRTLREEIDARGLADSLSVIETDFRDTAREYDKVVSIGTLEHAGRGQLEEVVAAHARFLKPGGLGMLHFIGHVGRFETEFYVRKHIFPGGWIPSLAQTIEAMERCGLEVIDVENLRRHYAPTLDEWARRFEANWERIHALDPDRFDERFRRAWLVYLVACAEMFRSPVGYTHLFQIVFSKGNITDTSYPMSRAHLYRAA